MIRGALRHFIWGKNRSNDHVRRSGFVGVGYPKTGNTWTRIMLGRYIKTMYSLEYLPLFDDGEEVRLADQGYDGPVGNFTHWPLSWNGQKGEDLNFDNTIKPFLHKTVLFITRHPLDALVSSFMHAKYKTPDLPYTGSLNDFIDDPVYGLDKFITFHNLWATHHGRVKDFLLWRYEDVRSSPETQLRRLLAFLGIEVNEVAVSDAIRFSSFENMKAMESAGHRFVYSSSGFNAFGDGPRDDPNAFHVREGKIGGYHKELTPENIIRLESKIRLDMPKIFGYN